MKPKELKQFFPALTGYRAIAAWIIFIYHFMPFNSPKYPLWIKSFVAQFHIGVDLFFVLSGFLITYRYFNDYPIHFKKYMVNRVARIYPMYFLITVAVFAVWFLKNSTWNPEKSYEFLFSITMTKALFTRFFLSGIPQGWTLTLEEMFYFTAPVYFILIRKSKFWLFALPFVLFAAFALLKYSFSFPGNTYGFLQTNIHAYIIEFFAGIGLAFLLLKNKIKISGQKFYTWIGLSVIVAYLIARPWAATIFDLKSDIGRFCEMAVLSIFGIAPFMLGLITEKTVVQKILSTKTMVLLGKASYIFYLIHKGFLPVWINENITDNKFLIFVIINLIAILLFKYIEEPLNLYIRRKYVSFKRI